MHRTAILAAGVFAAAVAPAFAQAQQTHIRGTIASYKDDVVTVTTAGGPVKVTLTPDVRVQVPVKVNLSDIKEGSYVGTTAVPQPDGTLKALEVHVFPPERAAQKPGEGFRPWDLTPTSTMTNATVTNVATVQGVGNRVLTLTYKDGEKRVIVPPNTPIVMNVPASTADLVPGAKVSITAQQGAQGYTSSTLTVSKNGVDPVS
jgi:hypothetical protein